MNNDTLNRHIDGVLADLAVTLKEDRHGTHGHAGLFGHTFAGMLRPYLAGVFETKRGIHDVDAFAILEIMKLARAATRHDPDPSYENAKDAAGYAILRAAFSPPLPFDQPAPAENAEPIEPEAATPTRLAEDAQRGTGEWTLGRVAERFLTGLELARQGLAQGHDWQTMRGGVYHRRLEQGEQEALEAYFAAMDASAL